MIKSGYMTLAIDQLGYVPYAMTLKLSDHRVKSLVYGKDGLAGGSRRVIAQALKRQVGYAHFLLCVDVTRNGLTGVYERPHLHGTIGIVPGDEDRVLSVLQYFSGGLSTKGRPVDLEPLRRAINWSWYASRTEHEAKKWCAQSHFASTQSLKAIGRRIFEESGCSHEVLLDLARDRSRPVHRPAGGVRALAS